jgi:16S rRNA (cytosine967-C5)-methyltransferase
MEHHGRECVVQNEAAAASVYLLDLHPGDTLVDICAAPGGKLTHALRQVGDEGRIAAFDLQPRRLRRLGETLTRVEAGRVLVARADGRRLPVREASKILLDAPCTGMGLLHRHPEVRWQKRPEDLERLCGLQAQLLEAAVLSLSPGGRLVYSTCSTCEEENEEQIDKLLARHPELSVVDPRPLLPEGVPASKRWVSILPDPPRLDGAFACALDKA